MYMDRGGCLICQAYSVCHFAITSTVFTPANPRDRGIGGDSLGTEVHSRLGTSPIASLCMYSMVVGVGATLLRLGRQLVQHLLTGCESSVVDHGVWRCDTLRRPLVPNPRSGFRHCTNSQQTLVWLILQHRQVNSQTTEIRAFAIIAQSGNTRVHPFGCVFPLTSLGGNTVSHSSYSVLPNRHGQPYHHPRSSDHRLHLL